jgi:hypothetical protein
LKTTLGKALFEIAALKAPEFSHYQKNLKLDMLDNSTSHIRFDYSSREGNSQQVFHLLDKINATQSSILALNYNWKLRRETKEKNQTVNRLCDSLFKLLALNNDVDLSYFNKTSRRQYTDNLKQKTNPKTDSAGAKIQNKKTTSLSDLDDNDSDSKTKRIESQKEKDSFIKQEMELNKKKN